MIKLQKGIFTLGLLLMLAGVSSAEVYSIDKSHSTLGFAVKHLGVGTTRGGFNDFSGEIKYDPKNLENFSADVVISVNSIDTNVEARDNHLKQADFFDAPNFPEITFKSDRLEKRGEGMIIIGDLTIRGVTKQLTIPVELYGPVQGMGGEVIGINAQTIINRQDFGVSWSKSLDNGGLVVDDNVTLIIEIEAGKKEEAK